MMLLRSCNVGEFCTTAAYDLLFMYLVPERICRWWWLVAFSLYIHVLAIVLKGTCDDVDSKPSCERQRREDVWISFTFPSTWVDTSCNDS